MKLLPSHKTVSVPQQKTWRQVDLTSFDVHQLENLSQLKSVDLVAIILRKRYLHEKWLFFYYSFFIRLSFWSFTMTKKISVVEIFLNQ